MKKVLTIMVLLIASSLIGCKAAYPKDDKWACMSCGKDIIFGNEDIKELASVPYDKWDNTKGFFCNDKCWQNYMRK